VPRPRIAVVGDFNGGNMERFGGDEAHHFLNARYTRAVEAAGGLPWLLPVPADTTLADAYLAQVDGLLMTGCGRHLDPAAYGQPARVTLNLMPEPKQALEMALIARARNLGMPILGICGGMQSINVALGGTLIQSIDAEVTDPLAHMQTTTATETVHEVVIHPDTLLSTIVATARLATNSSHTQAVGRPGNGVRVSASCSDGMVEAIEVPGDRWTVAVQWHPEYLYPSDPGQARLFATLVEAARKTG